MNHIRRVTHNLQGSIADVAARNKTDLGSAFLNTRMVILVDTSGSMDIREKADSEGNALTRRQLAADQLAILQRENPGQIGLISFASWAEFCPDGNLKDCGGGTSILKALEMAKISDGVGVEFVLVSDGEDYQPEPILELARTFQSPINTIFIGSGGGQNLLDQIAKASGGGSGKALGTMNVTKLLGTVRKLLVEKTK